MEQVEFGKPFQLDLFSLTKDDKPIEMLWVEPGTFIMGYQEPDAFPHYVKPGAAPFEVTLTHGFWMSRYPITVAQWHTNLGSSPELANIDIAYRNIPKSVNWYEANMFCDELNRTYYNLGYSQRFHMTEYLFRLPTEAQWEYACRAGTSSRYYNGTTEEDLDKIAWYVENSKHARHPVGEKLPNQWGFHDMLGNVHEWCLDPFVYYPTEPTQNWRSKPDPLALMYSTRGGSWQDSSEDLRCTYRGYQFPYTYVKIYGFRLCLSHLDDESA